MITLTEAAIQKICEIIEAKNQQGYALRLRISGRGTTEFHYEFRFINEAEKLPDDIVLDMGPFKLIVDGASAPNLEGTVIDFGGLGGERGLRIENPNSVWDDPVALAVANVVEYQINPGIRAHGGYVELIDVKDGVVTITMNGGCQGCGMAAFTLRMSIERMIREAVPEIQEIVDVTEHAAGTSPFYRAAASGASPLANSG